MISVTSTSFLSHLACPVCHATYNASDVHTVCQNPDCNSTLFAEYDLPQHQHADSFLAGKPASMWRYQEFLPIAHPANIVSLGEGFTPILPVKNAQSVTADINVYWKDESDNPTGSFKARGMSTAISKAKELGITDVVVPTAGNAGGAMAAYCARARITAHVYLPRQTPQVFKDECRLYGAELTEVDGNIADCGKLANQEAMQHGWFAVSTLKEPYRLEGKKTMGYEIAEQFHWQLPDVILYPTGGGTGLLGIWKAFTELEKMHWIGSKRPRMVAVQAESCDGITQAFHQNQTTSAFVDKGFTVANGLRVPKPYADALILKTLRESAGNAISVNDQDITGALKEIAGQEGMLIAPEGAALWVAFKKLKAAGWIKPQEEVLLLNTGNGYKYLENIYI